MAKYLGWETVREPDRRGRMWVNWVSPDGQLRLEQGHMKPDNAWVLLKRTKDGKWRWVRDIPGTPRDVIPVLNAVASKRSASTTNTK